MRRWLRRVKYFALGMYEFRRSFTKRAPRWSDRNAYDSGREWAHRLTFRRYD